MVFSEACETFFKSTNMAHISSVGGFPDPSAHIQTGSLNPAGVKNSASQKTAATPQPAADQAETSPIQAQLTRFSGVLTSLQNSSATNRAHYVQVAGKVRSGNYQVDSQSVSKSIVDGALSG